MNSPSRRIVSGYFARGSTSALSTRRMDKLYLVTRFVSMTLHSKLAKHCSNNCAFDLLALSSLRSRRANFPRSQRDVLPMLTTLVARS
jgi:hypothetical protein